jgi:hypothetical protein
MARKKEHVARDPNLDPDKTAKLADKVRDAAHDGTVHLRSPDDGPEPPPVAPPPEPPPAASKAAKGKPSAGGIIILPPHRIQHLDLAVVSDSCYISNRMDQKAVMMILAKHMQLPPEPRKAKDPYANFRACIHYLPDGSMGIPGGAFKAAMVGACRQFGKAVKMVSIKQFFHVLPDIVRVYGDTPRMCQHVVKNDSGVIDIRFRAMFFRWSAVIPIEYDSDLISTTTLAILANRAGFGVGVGDWRPGAPESFNGRCGRFHCARNDDLVGRAHTEWCAQNPANEVEMLMAGIVPEDLVETYRRAAQLPPPPEEEDEEDGKKKRSTKKRAPATSAEGAEILAHLKEVAARNPFEQEMVVPSDNGE